MCVAMTTLLGAHGISQLRMNLVKYWCMAIEPAGPRNACNMHARHCETSQNTCRILLANLFPRDRAAVATLDSPCSWAFNDGICEAQFSALGDSPTVTHEPGLSTAHENSGAISSRVSLPCVEIIIDIM